MADYTIEVAVPTVGPQGPQGPAGEFGELEAPQDGIIYGRKDGEWVDMTSPANLQVRRGTAAEVAAITPLEGEPVWSTDTKKLRIGDASTGGGIEVGPRLYGQPLTANFITGANTTIPASRSSFISYTTFGTSSTIDFATSGGQPGDFYIIILNVSAASATLTLRLPTLNLGGGNFNYQTIGTVTSGTRAFYVQHNSNNTSWTVLPGNLQVQNPVAINNAADQASAVTQLNALLGELRRLGIIGGS